MLMAVGCPNGWVVRRLPHDSVLDTIRRGVIMPWFYLVLAGCLEIVWAFALKRSEGFTNASFTGIFAVSLILSLLFLGIAMRSIPLSSAYAIWTGIGTLGAFMLGILVLNEPASLLRILAAMMILAGILTMYAET